MLGGKSKIRNLERENLRWSEARGNCENNEEKHKEEKKCKKLTAVVETSCWSKGGKGMKSLGYA